MKTSLLQVIICIALLTVSCSPSIQDTPKPVNTYKLQLKISLSKDILSFSQTKSFPEEEIPYEPGEEGTSSDLFNRIEYVVYKKEFKELIHHIQYKKEESEDPNEFGVLLYDELEIGSYSICLLAHSSDTVSYKNGSFIFQRPTDTFFSQKDITISGTDDYCDDLTLKRVVSKVEFRATDNVPEKVSGLQMNISPQYSTFNMIKGEASTEGNPYSELHTFTATEKIAGVKNKHSFYTFVPSLTSIAKAQLNVLDTNGNIVHSHEIENIPIEQNKIIRYTGKLYSPKTSDNTLGLIIENNGVWADTTHIKLN